MKFLAIVIVVVLVAAGATYFFFAETTEEPSVAVGSTSETGLQEVLEQSDAERAQLQEELKLAEARIQRLETEALESAGAAEEREEEPEEAAETPDENEVGKTRTLEEFRSKARETPQVRMKAKALTDVMYGEFLNGAQLESEIETEVRALMTDSLVEFLAGDAFVKRTSDDITWSEIAEWKIEERAFLTDQMRPLLSDEDNASWDAFLDDLDARSLDRALRAEIGMLSSGLTPESMEAVIEVGIAAFLGEQYALEESGALYTAPEQVHYRRRAIQSMREQLPAFLSEDQMADLENYLTYADNMLDSQLVQAEQRQERSQAERLQERKINHLARAQAN